MIKKLFVIFLVISIDILAQSFTASVSSTQVGEEDPFEVSFTFDGNDINSLANFKPPAFKNFLVMSGPNRSTNMQIINGAMSASAVYSYYIRARGVGTFTIEPASIEYEGKAYTTEPIQVTVVKGSTKPKQQQQESEPSISQKEIKENLFIRAAVDKKNVYRGEQVTVVYKLYTRLNIAAQMSISKLPQYKGFWAEEIETPNNISFTTETVNGKQFRVGVLKKVALFPSQTGELTVTPFELVVPIQIRKKSSRSRNLFDDFFDDPFFGRTQTIEQKTRSNAVKLNVKPLPADAPESFHGAVGKYEITSELDKNKTKTNEPVTYKVTIKGTGNIKLIDMPELQLPAGFEQYDPKTTENINRRGVVSGEKTVEYLLVPRSAGIKEIPGIEFSYFDPDKKSYKTLATKSFTIDVEQGEVVPGSSYPGKENVEVLGQDIRYIKTSNDLHKKTGIALYNFGFWAAAVIPLFALIGAVSYKKRKDKLAGNVQLLRYQKAQKVAKSRLKKAKKLLQTGSQTEFYSEVSQALFGYLEDKFHIPKADFTLERAMTALQNRDIDESLISEMKETAEKCEYIRFAPQNEGKEMMNEMYNKMAHVITEIERRLSAKKNV